MATPVYSLVLWEVNIMGGSGQQVLSDPVPTGFTWVAMSVAASSNSPPSGQQANSLIFYVDGFQAWTTPFNKSRRGGSYLLTEARLVLGEGSFFSASSIDVAGWHLRVTGFQLTN